MSMAGKYKLIFSDMDGTLLNSDSTMSRYNAEAIKKAVDRGAIFCMASGRPYWQIAYHAKTIGVNTLAIACNGAHIYDPEKGEYLKKCDIPVDEGLKFLRFCDENKIVWTMFEHYGFNNRQHNYVFTEVFGNYNDHFEEDYAAAGMEPPQRHIITTEDEYRRVLEGGSGKIMCASRDERHKELINEYFSVKRPGIMCNRTGNGVWDITSDNCGKWAAILDVTKILGIPLSKVAAFGDAMNDLEMIQNAAVSFAVSNADPELKKYATHVVESNNDDGVGKAIEKYILGNIG